METFRPKLIVAPTDFSETAAHALRYASALGERLDAHLLVMYADPSIPMVDSSFALTQERIDEAREQLLAHAEANVSAKVPYDLRVVIGSPVTAIVEHVRRTGADLIVMGTHGRGGLRRVLFGSVTAEVARKAPVPVIAVNSAASATAEVRKVLCPVTFDDACIHALRYAAALAIDPDAPLVLLQLIDNRQPEETLDRLLRLHRWAPTDLVDRCECKTLPAHSADRSIAELAKITSSDLIALSIPEGLSVREALRGSFAERVIRQSECAVLTVNSGAAQQKRQAAVQPSENATCELRY